jgi:hypothetical protein
MFNQWLGTTCCGPMCCNQGFKCCNEGINLGNELCCPISTNCCAKRSDGSNVCCGGNTPACCITGGTFKNCYDPFAFTSEPHCNPFWFSIFLMFEIILFILYF